MKKRVYLVILALICAIVLCACGCSHEEWIDADCDTPKTCAECGKTEGEPLGHAWQDATCEVAKHCETCGSVDGTPLGHKWEDADCVTVKTCTVCDKTEGEALGHAWLDATTEEPQTCERCALTEGERIITDPRFTTEACRHAFGEWHCTAAVTDEMIGLPGFGNFDCIVKIVLNPDSTMTLNVALADEEAFNASLVQYVVNVAYEELSSSGLSKEEIDQLVMDNYGVTMEEYAADAANSMDFNAIFAAFGMTGVYYIDGDSLYSGTSWDSLASDTVIFDGETMTLPNGLLTDESAVFTRVSQ